MLREEGIAVAANTAIDIGKIIYHTDLTGHHPFAQLKYRLGPVISRNKEEQDIIHSIFDRLAENLQQKAPDIEGLKEMYTAGVKAADREKKQIRKSTKPRKRWLEKLPGKKVLIPLAALAVVCTIILVLYGNDPGKQKKLTISNPAAQDIITNEPAVFIAGYEDSLQQQEYSVDWQFADTVIQNAWQVERVFDTAGQQAVTARLKNRKGTLIDSANYSFSVLCERPPAVQIINNTDTLTGKNKARKVRYAAAFTNADNTDGFRYKWYINDSLVYRRPELEYVRKANQHNTIRLEVDLNSQHCSTDTLTDEYKELPGIAATVNGESPLTVSQSFNWKNISLSLLWLLLIPGLPAYIIFRMLRRTPKPPQQTGEEKQPEDIEGPYDIIFPDQQHVINTEPGIKKLADTLRKRQQSDAYKLDIRNTIRSTIRSGGIPKLAFSPLTKPTDYLIFIDKEHSDSHITRLYEYLVFRLQQEQVNIIVYDYNKEPLYLSNEQRMHHRIPVSKLTALYPDTALFIFGNSRHFVFPLKGTIKESVVESLTAWPVKFFVTPYPKKDWDEKERLISQAGFTVIPADLSAHSAIDQIVHRQADANHQQMLGIPAEYSARFLNFQELNTLKQYLQDERLLKWVCALAVYPSVNWNLTLAIGRALESAYRKTDKHYELVNYSNLLKIGRISWLQDGILSDTLRIDMLQYLDNETEALARQTVLEQLQPIQNNIKSNSLIKSEYEVHENVNAFLVDAYNGQPLSKTRRAAISSILQQGQLHQAQEIYLGASDNTLLKHPFNRQKSVTPADYLKTTSRKQYLLHLGLSLSVMALLLITSWSALKSSALLQWVSRQPVSQLFIINKTGIAETSLFASYTAGDSIIRFGLDSDSFQVQNIRIPDTAQTTTLTIATGDGITLAETPLTLNAARYTMNLQQAIPVPVTIYYNSASDRALAGVIQQNLPSNFYEQLERKQGMDTGIYVSYPTRRWRDNAQLVIDAINRSLNISVKSSQMVSSYGGNQAGQPDTSGGIQVYVNRRQPCTQLAASALPQSLYEIWKGGTSNRLINIDLHGQRLYYSTGGPETYGTYRLDEICLMPNGAYKFITRTDKGYKVFFIRNIKRQSFELSVCQDNYTSKEAVQVMDESYCDRFNTMTLYYETDNNKIYLPLNNTAASLNNSEAAKLNRIMKQISYDASGKGMDYETKAEVLYSAWIARPEPGDINRYLQKGNVKYTVSSSDFKRNMRAGNPFARNYIMLSMKIIEEPNARPDNSEKGLGTVVFSGSRPDNSSIQLLERITKQLTGNRSSKIIIESFYTDESERKTLQANINIVKDLLYKYGVSRQYGQITERISSTDIQSNQQQQQQYTKRQTPGVIRILGINFPDSYLPKAAN